MGRVSALNVEFRLGEPSVSKEIDKAKCQDRIPVSGKTPKTQGKPEK